MENNWEQFDNGNTIGTRGSEGGVVIMDEEHTHGARISLEKETSSAPYTITLGIYGLLMHTAFYSDHESAPVGLQNFKSKIQKILDHYDLPEDDRQQSWREDLNRMMDEIAYS